MIQRATFIALGLLACAAGCSGGAQSGSAPVLPAAGGRAIAQLTVLIPAHPSTSSTSRNPAYVSPDTESIGVVDTPASAAPFPVVMTNVPGTACVTQEGGGYSCTIVIQAQPGDNTLTVTTYSAPDGGGSVLSSGTVLESFSATATPAPITVTLTGVVSKVALSISHDDLNGNTELDANVPVGQSATLYVTGEDAAGDPIVGTFDYPIGVSVSDGAISLGTTSFTSSSVTSTPITWNGGPTYYSTSTGQIAISAFLQTLPSSTGRRPAGAANLATDYLEPTSTFVSFPLGDGQPWDLIPMGMVARGNTLYYTSAFLPNTPEEEGASPPPSLGEWGTFDASSGARTTSLGLPFAPGAIFVDPAYSGIWMSSLENEGATDGSLECTTGVGATPVPFPLPSSVPAAFGLAADSAHHLWFTSPPDGVGNVTLNGQCSIDSDVGFGSVTLNGDEYSGYSIAEDSSGNVWVPDQRAQFVWEIAPNGTVNAVPFPGAGSASATTDASGNILVGGTGPEDETALVATAYSGASTFGATLALPSLFGTLYASAATNAGFAWPELSFGGVGYTPDANPAAGTVLGVPSASGAGCVSMAVDANNNIWVGCQTDSGASLDRLVLTNTWNLFVNPSTFETNNSLIAGIGGGDPSFTFTWSCSTNLTCVSVPGYGRAEIVEANEAGASSVCATDQNGRNVCSSFTIAQLILTSTHRRPAFFTNRRPILKGSPWATRLRQAPGGQRPISPSR